jgi:5-methylcytosine-specific restriction endonuclease McrA
LQVWNVVFEKDEWIADCPICLKNQIGLLNRKSWEIAHVKAHSQGGNEELSNLRPICRQCNRKMGTMHMLEYCQRNVPRERLNHVLDQLHLRDFVID